jgi:hypothetical protein
MESGWDEVKRVWEKGERGSEKQVAEGSYLLSHYKVGTAKLYINYIIGSL